MTFINKHTHMYLYVHGVMITHFTTSVGKEPG